MYSILAVGSGMALRPHFHDRPGDYYGIHRGESVQDKVVVRPGDDIPAWTPYSVEQARGVNANQLTGSSTEQARIDAFTQWQNEPLGAGMNGDQRRKLNILVRDDMEVAFRAREERRAYEELPRGAPGTNGRPSLLLEPGRTELLHPNDVAAIRAGIVARTVRLDAQDKVQGQPRGGNDDIGGDALQNWQRANALDDAALYERPPQYLWEVPLSRIEEANARDAAIDAYKIKLITDNEPLNPYQAQIMSAQ